MAVIIYKKNYLPDSQAQGYRNNKKKRNRQQNNRRNKHEDDEQNR